MTTAPRVKRRWLSVGLLLLGLSASVALIAWGRLVVVGTALSIGLAHSGHEDLPEVYQRPEGRAEHAKDVAEDERQTREVSDFARRCNLAAGALAAGSLALFVARRRASLREKA